MKCGQGKPFTMTSSNPKMGGAAIKSYEKGGMVTGPNPNIDDDTRARARQFAVAADAGVEPEVMPMPAVTASPRPRRAPIVTKEELAKEGLSLRDYMNKQQRLTRRKDPTAGTATSPERTDSLRSRPAPYETPYDRMNRENRENRAIKKK